MSLRLSELSMNAKQKSDFIKKHLGDAKQISDQLRGFRKSALVLSRSRPRMIEEHPQEWVAVYDGKVRATDKSFKRLTAPHHFEGS